MQGREHRGYIIYRHRFHRAVDAGGSARQDADWLLGAGGRAAAREPTREARRETSGEVRRAASQMRFKVMIEAKTSANASKASTFAAISSNLRRQTY